MPLSAKLDVGAACFTLVRGKLYPCTVIAFEFSNVREYTVGIFLDEQYESRMVGYRTVDKRYRMPSSA